LAAADQTNTFAPRAATRAMRTNIRIERTPKRGPASSFPTCTGEGQRSFLGKGFDDVAAGEESAEVAGSSNDACQANDFIGGGYGNGIDDIEDGFIGGGFFNAISGNTSAAFIGAGLFNAASGRGAFVGGGGGKYGDEQVDSASEPGNVASGEDSFVGAGDLNQVSGQGSFIGAGGSSFAATGATTAGNQVTGVDSFIGAGDNNVVNGSWSFVGGGEANAVHGPGSFIGAGGYLASSAGVTSDYIDATDAFIGAGDENYVGANGAFVGGGLSNVIIGGGTDAAIGGGDGNNASGAYAAVAGGYHNNATAAASAVGGGSSSSATGKYATIPGGYLNAASGIGSFAAGTQAKARHNGAFVWSDNNGTAPVQSTAPYQFVARASGGFYLFSNASETAGVRLNAGSGAWASLSDRSMKTGVLALDDAAVLAKVAALPVNEWSYTSEHGVRHVGPMAQDFYAAFGVGEDDRHITSIDEDGVALAAIKALAAENHRLHAENRELLDHLARYATHVAREEAKRTRDEDRYARDDAQRVLDHARLLALERKVDALEAR